MADRSSRIGPRLRHTAAAVFAAQVATAREAGGVILFSYDSLTGPTRGLEYLSQVGRAAFDR